MALIRGQDRSHRLGWLRAIGLIVRERGDGAFSRSRPLPQGACGGLAAGDWVDCLGRAVMVLFRGRDRSHENPCLLSQRGQGHPHRGGASLRGSGLDRESALRTAAAFIFRSTR